MTFAFIFESVGGTEWLVLLGVVLIVVGPKNLPSAARKLGSIMSTLRRAADEFKRQLLSMDEEFRKAVDEGENDAASETVSEKKDDIPEYNDTFVEREPSEDDPSTVPDSEDRAEEEGSAYDYNSPYPGHDYYDETQYQPAASDSNAGSEMGDGAAAAPQSEHVPEPEPAQPKPDPYAIKITVTSSAGKGKKK